MADVFLNYAKEDILLARKIYEDLTKGGLQVWFDEKSLIGGQDWRVEINKVIKSCKYFIALLSNNSVSKKGTVQKEVKEALKVLEELPESTIYLIPVRLEKCEPSYEALKKIHWIDLFDDWNLGIREILRATKIYKEKTSLDIFEIVNVSDSLKKCISLIKPMANERKINLNFEDKSEGARIQTRIEAFRVVCLNLLENAIKYSYIVEEEPHTWVNVVSYVRDENVFIRIQNCGIAIREKEITSGKIFEHFYVGVQSRKKGNESTGLGLAVVRKIVKESNGSITVSSLSARGSGLKRDYNQPFITTFTISFPIYKNT